MVNKVILVGRLGADPEVRYMQDGTMVTNFRLATDEQWKDKNGEKVHARSGTGSSLFENWPRSAGIICPREGSSTSRGRCRRDPGKTRMDRNDSRRRSSHPTCRCSSPKAAAGKKPGAGSGAPPYGGGEQPPDEDVPF